MNEICDEKIQTQVFLPHFKVLSKQLEKIGNITLNIKSILDERYKRTAPLAFIGTLSKTLFGTANEEDIDNINTLISENSQRISQLSTLMKNQTMLIKHNFKDIHNTLQKMSEIYNDTTLKISKLQNVTINNKKNINNLNESISIMNSISLTESFIESLKDDYQTILNAILFAKKGTPHPALITKEKIFNITKEKFANRINEVYPSENMDSFDDFNKLINLNMYLKQGKLMYVILIPFTNHQNYSLYYCSSNTVNLTKGFGYAKPKSNRYIVHENYKTYIPITETQMNKCKQINNRFICSESYIQNKLKSKSPCEIRLIFNQTIDDIETCDIRITKHVKSHWTQSMNIFKIYYNLPEEENITITCKSDSNTIKLKGFGYIRLTDNCRIESKDYKHDTPKTRTFYSSETISTALNLNMLKELLKIITFNNTNNNEDNDEFLFMENLDSDYGVRSTKLNDIIKKAEEINERGNKIRYKPTSDYFMNILIIIITILPIIILLTIYHLYKNKRNNNQRINAQLTLMTEIAPPPYERNQEVSES